MAWLAATDDQASAEMATQAVEFAARAIELTGGRDPAVLGTWAAAQAAVGEFTGAVATAQIAAELADGQGDEKLARRLRDRIKCFQESRPYRE